MRSRRKEAENVGGGPKFSTPLCRGPGERLATVGREAKGLRHGKVGSGSAWKSRKPAQPGLEAVKKYVTL